MIWRSGLDSIPFFARASRGWLSWDWLNFPPQGLIPRHRTDQKEVKILRAPLKTVLFHDGGVSRVLTASGAHKHGALCTVRPHVFAHTLRFSARGFLARTKNAWFLEVPLIKTSGLWPIK